MHAIHRNNYIFYVYKLVELFNRFAQTAGLKMRDVWRVMRDV